MRSYAIILLILIGGNIFAQDFGFGFGDEETGSVSGFQSALRVSIGGEVSAKMLGYIDDFSDGMDHVRLGDIFSGKLDFSARTANVDAFIYLNLSPTESPLELDEAYVHAYFGSFDIAAGLRKLTWGKADILGPLDVINPLKSSELFTVMADQDDLMNVKIARPLVHASFRFGQFSKIEGVFVPNFEGHSFDRTGRWAPRQWALAGLFEFNEPDTTTLSYAQAGIRFTSTVGSSDLGLQYYYGRLFQPSVEITLDPVSQVPGVHIGYDPYHQIGLDYAQVLYGFNTRAELAANITEDIKGSDGSVYNPFIAWSLGFDRETVLGINLNFQADQSIRLMHDRLGSASFIGGNFDIEGGQPLTATRLSTTLSRKFQRDELELRAALVWGIEDAEFVIMPALIWTKDDIRIAFSGGFFGGDPNGQIGQYRDNHFFKASLTYTF